MSDDHPRPRRHEFSDAATDKLDLERLRYFTQPSDEKPTTRHRRRRVESGSDLTDTGSLRPAVTRSAPDDADTEWTRPEPLPVQSGEFEDPMRRAVPHRIAPAAVNPSAVNPSAVNPSAVTAAAAPTATATRTHFLDTEEDEENEPAQPPQKPAKPRKTRKQKTPKQKRPKQNAPNYLRRRVVLGVAMVCLLALVAGVGFVGLRKLGVFENNKDYSNPAGTADVIVDIPDNSTLADFGRILEADDVVGSVNAFVKAANGEPLSGGYYKMRTQIPAETAVDMMTGTEHRVGRMVVPEGLQLDTKEGIDGKTTPGIFQMISDATSVTVNGQRIGASIDQLEETASNATADELGVPVWARPTVNSLTGDHRRIEGLIAPGTWERIDPNQTPVQILHDLLVASAQRYEEWGLLSAREQNLTPYQTLIAASVVEREVADPDDYAKVARVIVNRLDKGQRLEMDSTANYTAQVTNIDVHGENYSADNPWNTYRVDGLPVTPIGAVGQAALQATEHPASGKWLYFVTVDNKGTTLFADDFEQHKANREKACENKLLTTGCS
ncbi:endolytic transglycosylase MltG [Gordonia sp. CPCC 205515]|uniref:endolytic transglycosylase MltG n=1 Tax=Gordonia sp. CPCC 205515 TaxID=3140791 RepID=UPI003AF357DD